MQISVKVAQATHNFTKDEWGHEWKKTCIEIRMWPKKLKALVKIDFVSKVIMFEKTLGFEQIIITWYGRQKTITWQQRIPKAQKWAVVKVITSHFNLVVKACLINRSHENCFYLMLQLLSLP